MYFLHSILSWHQLDLLWTSFACKSLQLLQTKNGLLCVYPVRRDERRAQNQKYPSSIQTEHIAVDITGFCLWAWSCCWAPSKQLLKYRKKLKHGSASPQRKTEQKLVISIPFEMIKEGGSPNSFPTAPLFLISEVFVNWDSKHLLLPGKPQGLGLDENRHGHLALNNVPKRNPAETPARTRQTSLLMREVIQSSALVRAQLMGFNIKYAAGKDQSFYTF